MSDSDSNDESVPENPLQAVPPGILAELLHLNLSGRVVFKQSRVINGGAYGDICKAQCKFQDGTKLRVAVKRLRFYLSEDIKMLFEKEIYVWSKLRHPNILPLLGFAFDNATGFPMLVSEWMEEGSAWLYVLSHHQCDLVRLITGIAQGLAYLHKENVVHSDLKSDNILVTNSGEALICDFGCARMIAASRTLGNLSTGLKGTSRYLAFELVAPTNGQFSGHTKETDVWAFGMTVFELLARQRPYPDLTDGQVFLAISKLVLPALPSLQTSPDSESKRLLYDICLRCWKHNPSDRADIASILDHLHSSQANSIEDQGPMTFTTMSPIECIADGANLESQIWLVSPALTSLQLARLSSVQLTTTAKNQGFIDNQSAGSCWSWFELAIIPPHSETSHLLEESVSVYEEVKKRADGTALHWRSHENACDWARREGHIFGRKHEIWQHLSPGDHIAVIACAQFPEWRCQGRAAKLQFR